MKVLSVLGNRPQLVKSAALSLVLRAVEVEEVVVHTGQHYDRELSQVFFEELDLPEPRYRLELQTADPQAMKPGIATTIQREQPDLVLVYGDTNSTLAGARAALAAGVRIAHVEAGLRSGDLSMPEEHTRIEVDGISSYLFCPDERSQSTLRDEGAVGQIHVVGDVMADASRRFAPLARERYPIPFEPGSYVVATIHREANVFQPRLGGIVEGLNRIPERVVFPAHPRTRAQIEKEGFELAPHVHVTAPLTYLELGSLASQARAIVTDSGGLQKEAYWYGVPCVTVRPSTEWVDTVIAGANLLVEADPDSIAAAVAGARMPDRRPVLYGDGHASERIADVLPRYDARPMKRDVAIVGAGYVGLPLAQTFADAGKTVVLVDVEPTRVAQLNRGESYVEDVTSDHLRALVESGDVAATTDYDELREADAILVALPTPLSRQREPDLRILVSATEEIAKRLRPGHLVVLESTTYPGTTREQVQPVLEAGSGLIAGQDFHLAFSPERVDPGNRDWTTKSVTKVVGGVNEDSTAAAVALYSSAFDDVYPVSSPEAAELTKLLENIFRSVNIALVNELAQLCDRMNIDVWEVVEAAATKPFGFMSFKPGPGLGGHCIPIDPFYLTWKAREYGFYTEFIELAGKVNESMPYHCRSIVSQALNHARQRSLKGSRILVLGVAYKPDISDMRESPAVKLIGLLENAGADVSYHDPHVAELEEDGLTMRSVPLEPSAYDCVVIVTDHSTIDYDALVEEAQLVVDLRNATGANGRNSDKVWKL